MPSIFFDFAAFCLWLVFRCFFWLFFAAFSLRAFAAVSGKPFKTLGFGSGWEFFSRHNFDGVWCFLLAFLGPCVASSGCSRLECSGMIVDSPNHQIRGSIVVSISACHAEDPGSIPGRGVLQLAADFRRSHIKGEQRSAVKPWPWPRPICLATEQSNKAT